MKRIDKPFAQAVAVIQGTAEEHDLALDLSALRQSSDGLADDRLIDARGDVFFVCALVEQGLYVRLGEHAAA